jgi:hypothetical protein
MTELSSGEQDEIIDRIMANPGSMDADELNELEDQLDDEHRQELAETVTRFADGAVGDDSWDQD